MKYIYGLPDTQAIVKGKPKSAVVLSDVSDGVGQKTTNVNLAHGKLLLDTRRK